MKELSEVRRTDALRARRKQDHISQALASYDPSPRVFDDIHPVHDCVHETESQSVSLRTRVGGLDLDSPIIINAMTGGAGDGERINSSLARIAAAQNVALAVGSQRLALEDRTHRRSFESVREGNPAGLVFANLSAACSPHEALGAVEMVRADALQLHLNIPQEVVMAEGDREFGALIENIAAVTESLSVPVFAKEVGFGVSGRAAVLLRDAGVAAIDVAGKGGTNFARIEAGRNGRSALGDVFGHWGLPTAVSLAEVADAVPEVALIAGGGLRNGLDVLKALILGASAASFAGHFLFKLVKEGESGLTAAIEEIRQQLSAGMRVLGAASVDELRAVDYVVTGETALWLQQREIPLGRKNRATTTR